MRKIVMVILILVAHNLMADPFGNFKKIPKQYQSICQEIQIHYNVSDWLLASVPFVESSWNKNAISYANCRGLMQISAEYEDYFVDRYWKNNSIIKNEVFNVWNGEHCLVLGFAYLSDLINRFGSVELGLCAFNCGSGRTARRSIPEETIDYIVKIKNMRVSKL